MGKQWVPLESNPEVLTAFSHKIGLDASHSWVDVVGLDEESLDMVPKPAAAVLVIYPTSAKVDAALVHEHGELVADSPAITIHQTIHNACGTIALLHALTNASGVTIAPGSLLEQFIEGTAGMSPADRGHYLEEPPAGAPDFEAAHHEAAASGHTPAPSAEDKVDHHFVTLVEKDGNLYELDGHNLEGSFLHGPTSSETFLADAAKVVQKFISRANSDHFSVLALAPTA